MNTTVEVDSATLKVAAEAFTSTLDRVQGFEGVVFSLTLQPYPLSLLQKCISAGGNTTSLSPDTGPLVPILVLMNWKNKEDDDQIIALAKTLTKRIEADATAGGQAISYTYMNYAFRFHDPIGSHGAKNKVLLQRVSTRYDPEGIFQ